MCVCVLQACKRVNARHIPFSIAYTLIRLNKVCSSTPRPSPSSLSINTLSKAKGLMGKCFCRQHSRRAGLSTPAPGFRPFRPLSPHRAAPCTGTTPYWHKAYFVLPLGIVVWTQFVGLMTNLPSPHTAFIFGSSFERICQTNYTCLESVISLQ